MNQIEFNTKLLNTPTIANQIVDAMPSLVKECCQKFENDERRRDVFLTACLAVMSAIMPKIWGRYDVLKLNANLYLICVAPPASGKGVAIFAKKLIRALHEAKKSANTSAVSYQVASNGFLVTLTIEKRKHGLYIPANTSAAMFLQQLSENKGEGLLFETEIDTLVNSLSQDWGDFSSQLREAYQHEDISYARKTEALDIEIERPKLSLFLTGTPNQLLKLIPCSENGLFSRNWFYCFRQELKRIDVRPKLDGEGFDEYFLNKGEEVKQMAAFLEAYPGELRLSNEQWVEMNETLNERRFSANATHGGDADSLSTRFGINMFRLTMVLSAIRKWERKDEGDIFYCSNEDFKTALALSKVYMEHTLVMLEALPKSNVGVHKRHMCSLFQNLPSSFSSAEAVALGEQLGISSSTVARRLSGWLVEELLLQPAHGKYQKP